MKGLKIKIKDLEAKNMIYPKVNMLEWQEGIKYI